MTSSTGAPVTWRCRRPCLSCRLQTGRHDKLSLFPRRASGIAVATGKGKEEKKQQESIFTFFIFLFFFVTHEGPAFFLLFEAAQSGAL